MCRLRWKLKSAFTSVKPWCRVFENGFESRMKLFVTHTSEANDSLFFSPPEIPRSLPGIPMYVSAHFDRPSFGRKTSGSESAYSLDSRLSGLLDLAERDLDDSSILGYQTVTSLSTLYDICRCSSPALRNWKKFSGCLVHGKPFTPVGEERDSLRQKRRAKEHNKTTIVYVWIQTGNFTVQCGNR